MEENRIKFEFLMDFSQALSVVERPANKSLSTILTSISDAMSEGCLTAEKDLNSIFAVVDAADNVSSSEREYTAVLNTRRAGQLAADEKAAKAHPIYKYVDSAIVLSEYEPTEDPEMYSYIVRRAQSNGRLEAALLALAPTLFPSIVGDPVVKEAEKARAKADKREEWVTKANARKGSSYCNAYAAALMEYVSAVQKVICNIAALIAEKDI